MKTEHLERVAAAVIAQTLRQLPDLIREAASRCVIELASLEDCRQAGEDLEDDLLGLFEGLDNGGESLGEVADLPRIRLFLDALWLASGRDRGAFRDEVRLTLLHELGHYLGLDEAQVAALGLA